MGIGGGECTRSLVEDRFSLTFLPPAWILVSAAPPAAIRARTLCGVCAKVPFTRAANAVASAVVELVGFVTVLMNLVIA